MEPYWKGGRLRGKGRGEWRERRSEDAKIITESE
jgi:hypothetical protein